MCIRDSCRVRGIVHRGYFSKAETHRARAAHPTPNSISSLPDSFNETLTMDPFEKPIEALREIVRNNEMRRRVQDSNRTATEILARLSGDRESPCADTAAESQRDLVDEAAKQLGVKAGSWRTPAFQERAASELAEAKKEMEK